MLDHHERRAGRLEHAGDGIPDLDDPGGVEVRGRLIEQQQAGSHREHPGECEALALPAREGARRAVERDLEADRVEGFAHAPPGLLARNPEVLAAERDVVPDAREDDLRVRILQHEPGATAHGAGRFAVNRQRPLLLALVGAEHARERAQQRRLARAGCPEQQHSLPRLDPKVESSGRPGEAGGVPPTPARRAHG